MAHRIAARPLGAAQCASQIEVIAGRMARPTAVRSTGRGDGQRADQLRQRRQLFRRALSEVLGSEALLGAHGRHHAVTVAVLAGRRTGHAQTTGRRRDRFTRARLRRVRAPRRRRGLCGRRVRIAPDGIVDDAPENLSEHGVVNGEVLVRGHQCGAAEPVEVGGGGGCGGGDGGGEPSRPLRAHGQAGQVQVLGKGAGHRGEVSRHRPPS
jgi:hypothetical protein